MIGDTTMQRQGSVTFWVAEVPLPNVSVVVYLTATTLSKETAKREIEVALKELGVEEEVVWH